MDYYRKLLTEEKLVYRIEAQTHIQIGEEINIGIEDVKRAVRSLNNGRACGDYMC